MTARKFAISLPEELFERLEQDRQERRMNRSEYVANAVADHLHRKREQELEEQYVRGYLEHPETEEELAEIRPGHRSAPSWNPGSEARRDLVGRPSRSVRPPAGDPRLAGLELSPCARR